MTNLQAIWQEFLSIVKEEAGSRVVETWLKVVYFHKWDSILNTAYLNAPNKFVLAKLAQMKSMAEEEAANGKVQIAIPALAVAAFGGGTTIPSSAYGKKF